MQFQEVGIFYFPIDFMIIDILEELENPLILGRPFMKIAKINIDMDKKKM